jgi:replication factor A1
MHKTREELYELVKDLKTKQEFETEIKQRFQTYNELLDEDTVALLIVDELGRNKQPLEKIADIKPNTDCTVIGKVIAINQLKQFVRKNGTKGKVINLEISDETGICRLVLWNKDIELVKTKEISTGTTIKIINGYVKDGFQGLEINLGRWGLLEVVHDDFLKSSQCRTSNHDEIEGELVKKEPTHAFFKDNGDIGFVAAIQLKMDSETQTVTIWDEKVKEIQSFKVGDFIKVLHCTERKLHGKKELHVNGNSIIKRA